MKKKIIVSALALAIGTGLAGSVTSTIAWYQYSTRTNAALVGVAGGVKGNLKMRIKKDGQADNEGWVTKILKEDMNAYLANKNSGTEIVPITSGNMAKDAALPDFFYCNPIYMHAQQSSWKQAIAKNYVSIPLEIKFVEEDSEGTEKNLAKDVYLSDLYLEKDSTSETAGDISSALRLHVASFSQLTPASKSFHLISKNGGTTATCGQLDLNGDGEDDVTYAQAGDKYGFTSGGETTPVMYGGTSSSQTCYSATVEAPSEGISPVLADLNNGVKDSSRLLGRTLTDEDAGKYLEVDVTIWVEGWAKLPEGNNAKAIWDITEFGKSKFDVGFEFEADVQQSKTNNIDYALAKPRAILHVALRV